MTLRELVKQPNKCIVVYFNNFRQFMASDLHEYLNTGGICRPYEDNGTRAHICTYSMRGDQFAGMLPHYIVVKGDTWEQWEGHEQLTCRLTRTGGELVYDK